MFFKLRVGTGWEISTQGFQIQFDYYLFSFFAVFVNGLLALLNHFSYFGERHKELRDNEASAHLRQIGAWGVEQDPEGCPH